MGTSGEQADELAGIFVLDRDRGLVTRIRGSEVVSRLAFTDFVGRDSIVFLLSGADDEERSRFRLVCCVSDQHGR